MHTQECDVSRGAFVSADVTLSSPKRLNAAMCYKQKLFFAVDFHCGPQSTPTGRIRRQEQHHRNGGRLKRRYTFNNFGLSCAT